MVLFWASDSWVQSNLPSREFYILESTIVESTISREFMVELIMVILRYI